ncbi:hypothetical protein JQM66_02075 [Oscillibacter valericigenes]|uniref:hypothetical protein n=1 Tax=Oscillibacter valericigenes TaxID=351091 RepID=UPI001F34489D|nr:hypothetical protein [Oscillibacter valericigenes]MCF2663343.1 hypothetical protein [Oscillibacter valericigenes]
MMKSMYTTQMSHGASAPCANAASSCAQAASMRSANIALILDAIIMASIIICGLNVRLSILAGSLLVLVLLVVLLVCENMNAPRMRKSA